MQGLVCRPEFFDGHGVVNFNRREGVVVDAKDFLAADKFSGFDRVVRPHREIVADAQRGEIQFGGFADEFHVQCQGGVTGEIKISGVAFDHKTASIAAIGAVGHRTGVDCVDEFGAAKIEGMAATVVQRMHARRSLCLEPGCHFEVGNHQRMGAFGDFHCVANVVIVPVRNKDEIRRNFFYVNGFCQRIAGYEWIKQQNFAAHGG